MVIVSGKKKLVLLALFLLGAGGLAIYYWYPGLSQRLWSSKPAEMTPSRSAKEYQDYLEGQYHKYQQKGEKGLRQKQYLPLIETLKRMLAQYPNNISLTKKLAFAYFSAGLYDKAEPLLKEVVGHEGTDADIYYQLGFIAKEKGKKDESVRLVKRALELNPKHQGAMELSK